MATEQAHIEQTGYTTHIDALCGLLTMRGIWGMLSQMAANESFSNPLIRI